MANDTTYKRFAARFQGKCAAACGNPVQIGETVWWSPQERGKVFHDACYTARRTEPTDPRPAPQADAPVVDHSALLAQVTDMLNAQERSMRSDMAQAIERALATLPVTVVVPQAPPADAQRVEGAHHRLATLIRLMLTGEHVYVYGPPGSGKSAGAMQAAGALGKTHGYISLNPQTPESRLIGYLDATGTYRATPFYDAYVNGGVFIIDEVDNAHPAVLNMLNGMLETDADGVARGAFPIGVYSRRVLSPCAHAVCGVSRSCRALGTKETCVRAGGYPQG